MTPSSPMASGIPGTTIARLGTEQGLAALEAATAEPDPTSLAAAERLRSRFDPELAAAALHQCELRRRARTKFGDCADRLLFTGSGLEQASRAEVAGHRARRLQLAGIERIVDLGCGIGADSLAFAGAGLQVLAVDTDPEAAAATTHNLAPFGSNCTVEVATAEDSVRPGWAAFCDPARRDGRGRVFDPSQFSPPFDFVLDLLRRGEGAVVKLGPALPHRLVPDGVEAEWVSHRGDVVEVCLHAHADAVPGAFSATLLPSGERLVVTTAQRASRPAAAPIGALLHEPDGAAIRAGALGLLAERHDLTTIDPQIAWLSSDACVDSPFLTSFEVLDVLTLKEKLLRGWLRDHDVGTLEIKVRGIDLDPAALRRRLKLAGTTSAVLIATRIAGQGRAVLARRI